MRQIVELRLGQGRWQRYLIVAQTVIIVALLLALLTPGAGRWVRAALTVPALLVLPGLALVRLLVPRWEDDLISLLTAGIGLSLACSPLLLAWLTWMGGRWSPALLVALLVLCAALAIAGPRLRGVRAQPWPAIDWPTALPLALVLAVTLALRLDQIRGILMPAWSDSYQHVVITQLIMNGGRLPSSYAPFADINSFRYHFGFHTVSAFAGWLAGWPAHQAVLYMGQILNALSPLTIYFFLAYGLKDRRAGVVGAAVAGLLTIAPANYVNFGRYPQLAGQVILPVAMGLSLRSLWAQEGEARPWGLAGVAAAGVCLSHYRVMLFFACFVAALALLIAWHYGRRRGNLRPLLGAGAGLGALALFLVGPWLWHLAQSFMARMAYSKALAATDSYNTFTWDFLFSWGAAAPLIAGAVLAILWGLIRRSWKAALLTLWVGTLILLSNPRFLHLPTTFVNNGALVLAIYLPVSMLCGWLAGDLLQWLAARWGGRLTTLALTALALVGCVAGARTLNRSIIEPWRFFITRDDLAAMDWVRQNTPPDALFAVQAYQDPGALSVHGIDAGLWLPYFTGRRSTVPPMIYDGEMTPQAASVVTQRALDTERLPADHAALQRLRAQGVSYAYVVEPRINFYTGLWQPKDFVADPAYHVVYHRGTVWIFALNDVS